LFTLQGFPDGDPCFAMTPPAPPSLISRPITPQGFPDGDPFYATIPSATPSLISRPIIPGGSEQLFTACVQRDRSTKGELLFTSQSPACGCLPSSVSSQHTRRNQIGSACATRLKAQLSIRIPPTIVITGQRSTAVRCVATRHTSQPNDTQYRTSTAGSCYPGSSQTKLMQRTSLTKVLVRTCCPQPSTDERQQRLNRPPRPPAQIPLHRQQTPPAADR